MSHPLKDVFSTIEVSRKFKYNNEKYHQRAVPPEIHRVARNLFGTGPQDADEYIAQCRKDLDEVNSSRNQSWGFDFGAEMPVPTDTATFKWFIISSRDIHSKKSLFKSQASKGTKERTQNNRITNYMAPRRKRTTKDASAASAKPSQPSFRPPPTD